MFGSTILDVAIGIVFIFVLVSTVCSAIREVIETGLKTRAAYLERGIRELLHDRAGLGLARSFFGHPLINSLYSGTYGGALNSSRRSGKLKLFASGHGLPSYIPSRSFALTLLDIAARGPTTDAVSSDAAGPVLSLAGVRAGILNLQSPPVQRALLTAVDTAQGDLERARVNIEAWYDSAMDRVSGWYKRSTQWIIFITALVLAAGLNIDTLAVADYLYRHDAVRETLIAQAARATGNTNADALAATQAAAQLRELSLPIGWGQAWKADDTGASPGTAARIWNWIGPLLGWLVTAFAATMGAPFWFDLLNKIMVIRSTVKPHEKSPEEASEDRSHRSSAPPNFTTQAPQRAFIPPAQPAAVLAARDADSDIDGCCVHSTQTDVTSDEHLPPARGGVA